MRNPATSVAKILLCSCFAFYTFSAAAQLTVTFPQTTWCNWQSTQQICPIVTGGSPPYTYSWSHGATGSCTYYYIHYGNFTVTVTDAMGLTATATTNANAVVNISVHTEPEFCSNNDGKAWVEINGGTPPYNICWLKYGAWGSCYSTDSLLLNLSADDFFVLSLYDSNGCVGYDSVLTMTADSLGVEIERQLPYTYTIFKTNHDCPQLGTAAVHVTGGVPPITYEWNTIPPQFTDSVGGLFAGSYRVTISDNTAGCSVTETVNILNSNPLSATVTSTPEVCNFNNGTATVVPLTGTPPYTYQWNTTPLQTTPTATDLSFGPYSVTVIDDSLCTTDRGVYVGYTSPVQPNPVAVNEICDNDSGSITLTPLLGTAPYTYQWSNGATTATITGLSAGNYSFTVDDVQSCSVTGSKNVLDVPPFSVTVTTVPQTCLAPGSATVNVTGASGPFTYRWSTNPNQTTQTATGLSSGFYYVTVMDADSCIAVRSVNVQYDPLVKTTLHQSPALCLTSTGKINNAASGGQPPYTFQWSNSATTQHLNNVAPGNYTVTITDANNCKLVKSEYVRTYSNLGLNVTSQNATCIFTNDGSATANVTNATPPITYRWGDGQTTQTAVNLPATWRYGVIVTDANGCSVTRCSNSIGYNNLSCAVQVNGKVLHDKDADCTFTPGDEGMWRIPVNLIPGYHQLTQPSGNFHFIVPPGNYALNHNPPYHMFQLCPVGSVELFGMAAGDDTTVNFYDTVRTALDLSINFGYNTPPRPGYEHEVCLTYRNKGNLTANAVVEYDYDADVNYVSSTNNTVVHDALNRKLTFTFNNSAPGDLKHFKIFFQTPVTTLLGQQVKDCVHVFPKLNDVSFIDNQECDSTIVVGSFDPNDKAVTPQGRKVPGNVGFFITQDDSVLHYKIRFQNTGTYPAENVAILDTLDEDLDISSIRGFMSSHDFRAEFFMNKYLAFYFDNIFLPDSFSNERESHGFVSFYIELKPHLPPGTEIKNRAAIYFDYNEPVITNTVTVKLPDTIIYTPEIFTSTDLLVYPNPAENILNVTVPIFEKTQTLTVYDGVGKEILRQEFSEEDLSISTEKLPNGIYFIEVKNDAGRAVRKFVVNRY